MVHPAFIYVLLLLAVFTVRLGCAQNLVMQFAPLPVIEGKINGMDVVAQGGAVAFFAGNLPDKYSKESCAEDLHCTLHKDHTHAVMISPEGIGLLQLNPDHLEQDEDEEDESSSLVQPSMTLNTLQSSSTTSFEELFISTEDIEPTPTLATLYTGNPVVDQTPGLAWINSVTIKLLATTVQTVNLLPTSTTSSDFDESALIDPAPTDTVKVMTTITGELDELRRLLISSATAPVVTPVQSNSDDSELESDEIMLEIHTDILMIRPSPSGKYGKSSGETNAFTFSVKQVPTSTGSANAEARSGNNEPTTSETQTTATEEPKGTNFPQAAESKPAADSPNSRLDSEEIQLGEATLTRKRKRSEEDQSTSSHFSDNTANNDQKGRVAEYTEWWKLPAEEESEDQSDSELDSNYSACSCEEVPSDYDIPPSPKKEVDRSRFPGSIPDDIMEKVIDAELEREQRTYECSLQVRKYNIRDHKLKHRYDHIQSNSQLSREEREKQLSKIDKKLDEVGRLTPYIDNKYQALKKRNQLINEHHQRFCPKCNKRMVWDEHGHEVSYEGGDPCTKYYYMCFKCCTHKQLFYDSYDYNLEWPDGHTCPDPYQ